MRRKTEEVIPVVAAVILDGDDVLLGWPDRPLDVAGSGIGLNRR